MSDEVDVRPDASAEVDVRRVRPAFANWGRWVVKCATGWCTNAWMPQLGETEWQCGTCGLPTTIVWPQDPIAVEALLLMRPDPNTRNWEPTETLDDLVIENALNGLLPEGADLTDQGEPVFTRLVETLDGYVVGGLVYGPIERWRVARPASPSITVAGEARAYREIGA